ncbi:MAG TPA: hypothetical protein VMS99_09905 [Acidimicrobiia bacterium]|nr:hypothetical protein [Acidimicrobiia bacterium]
MDLEPVSAVAGVGSALVVVSVEDGSALGGWDGPFLSSVAHGDTVLTVDGDFGDPITEDGLEGVFSDSWSGFEDHSCFPVCSYGVLGVDEHGDLGWWRIV